MVLGKPLAAQDQVFTPFTNSDPTSSSTTFSGDASPVDSLDLSTMQLHLNIPIISYPQRGGILTAGYHLEYSPNTLEAEDDRDGGWTPLGGSVSVVMDLSGANQMPPFWTFYQVDPQRSLSIDGNGWCIGCFSSSAYPSPPFYSPFYSDKNGTVYFGQGGDKVIDRNGNTIQIFNSGPYGTSQVIDTVGRNISGSLWNNMSIQGQYPTTSCESWTIPAISGSSGTYNICQTIGAEYYTPEYVYSPTGVCGRPRSGCTPNVSQSNVTIANITFPDGRVWSFDYDYGSGDGNLHAGDLTAVHAPTGANITYSWGQLVLPNACTNVQATFRAARTLTSRTIDFADGLHGLTWNYQIVKVNTSDGVQVGNPSLVSTTDAGSAYAVLVTDVNGNDVVHTMLGIGGTCTYREVLTETYQGPWTGGVLLASVTRTYGAVVPTSGPNIPPYGVIWPYLVSTSDGHDTKTFQFAMATGAGAFPQGQAPVTFPFAVNSVIDTNPTGSVLRQVNYSYLWQSDANYLNANLLSSVNEVDVSDGATTASTSTTFYDEPGRLVGVSGGGSPLFNVRGNPTSTKNLIWFGNGPAEAAETDYTYNSNGTINTINGPHGASATLGYDGNFLYATSVTNSLSQTDSYTYDFNTGLQTSHTDANGQLTQYCYDLTGRPTATLTPDGGGTSHSYNDAALTETVSALVSGSNGSNCSGSFSGSLITTVAKYDGFHRLQQVTNTTDPGGPSSVSYIYDQNTEALTEVSDPSRSGDPATNGTGIISDILGRPASNTRSGSWCYSLPNGTGFTMIDTFTPGTCGPIPSGVPSGGSWKDFTNLQGATWEYVYNADGSLNQVVEPDPVTGQPTLKTVYAYDVLGDVTSITQSGKSGETARVRRFSYDSLGHLRKDCQPEQTAPGTSCDGTFWSNTYDYYDSGNLRKKTDANNQSVTYHYDALGRLTSATSLDGTINISRTYDGCTNGTGRLCIEKQQGFGIGGTQFTYDLMGRVASTQWYSSVGNGWGTGMTVHYDLAGNVVNLVYPSGRTITQTWDGAGRLATVTNAGTGEVYMSGQSGSPGGGIAYTGFGAVSAAQYGNGVTQNFSYDGNLHLTHTQASTPVLAPSPSGVGNLVDKSLFYSPQNQVQNPSCPMPQATNVNIYRVVNNLPTALTAGTESDFCYDQLGRLTSAALLPSYSFAYGYDSFGNMVPADQINNPMGYTIDPATNRMQLGTEFGYDNAGELTTAPNPLGGSHALNYDALGNLIGIDSGNIGTYFYDSFSERSTQWYPGGWDVYTYLNGKEMMDFNSAAGITEYVYANGKLIVRMAPSSTYYYLSDQVGTARVETDITGNPTWSGEFTPFGQEVIGGSTTNYIGPQPNDGTLMNFKFAGYERDAESGLDYAKSRMYSSMMGRFTKPDPLWSKAFKLEYPQTFNMYSYALNNPLQLKDPTGGYCYYGDDTEQDHEDGSNFDYQSSESECSDTQGRWTTDGETHFDFDRNEMVDNEGRDEGYALFDVNNTPQTMIYPDGNGGLNESAFGIVQPMNLNVPLTPFLDPASLSLANVGNLPQMSALPTHPQIVISKQTLRNFCNIANMMDPVTGNGAQFSTGNQPSDTPTSASIYMSESTQVFGRHGDFSHTDTNVSAIPTTNANLTESGAGAGGGLMIAGQMAACYAQ